MNLLILENHFPNFKIHPKKSNERKTLFIIKEKDRLGAKFKLQNILRESKIEFEDIFMRSYSSSLNVDIVTMNDHKYVFTYKPLGGGSGAGSEATALNESAQCVYCAVAQGLRRNVKTDDVKEHANEQLSFFDINVPVEDVIEKLDDSWKVSSTIIANNIRKELDPAKKYVFHRGSDLVSIIETKYFELNRKEPNRFSNINKWNPADIWIASPTFNIDKIKKTDSLSELNEVLRELALNKELIGVSLKKVSKFAKLTKHNIESRLKKYKLKSLILTPQSGNIFSSKDIYIDVVGPKSINLKIQFRTFNIFSSWQGEIKGRLSNLGKVSHGTINSTLAGLKMPLLEDQKKLRTKIMHKKNEVMLEMYQWYMTIFPNVKMPFDEFETKFEAKPNDWVLSKYLGLQLYYILYSNKKKQDKFVSGLFNYAESISELSGPFYKYS